MAPCRQLGACKPAVKGTTRPRPLLPQHMLRPGRPEGPGPPPAPPLSSLECYGSFGLNRCSTERHEVSAPVGWLQRAGGAPLGPSSGARGSGARQGARRRRHAAWPAPAACSPAPPAARPWPGSGASPAIGGASSRGAPARGLPPWCSRRRRPPTRRRSRLCVSPRRVVAAYLLAALGGNAAPAEADIKKILSSVGIEAEAERVSALLKELEGKDVSEVGGLD